MSSDNKTVILCVVGPPCFYLLVGHQWECSFDGICQYQRPLIDNSQPVTSADKCNCCEWKDLTAGWCPIHGANNICR